MVRDYRGCEIKIIDGGLRADVSFNTVPAARIFLRYVSEKCPEYEIHQLAI